MTSWQRLTQDLRAHFVLFPRSEVRRKDLISIAEIKYGLNPRRWTLDNYVRYLRKAGFLETVSSGVYKHVKEIPVDLTLRACKKLAYQKKSHDEFIFGVTREP